MPDVNRATLSTDTTLLACDVLEGFAEVAYRVAPSRRGPLTLWLAGRSVHSAVDPQADAERTAAALAAQSAEVGARVIVLIGVGLGLMAARLRDQTRLPILAFEPFPGVASALRAGALTAPLAGIDLVHDVAGCARALDAHGPDAARALVHRSPVYSELCRFESRWLARDLRRRSGRLSPAPGAAIVSARALDAMRRLPRLGGVDAAGPVFAGQTAFLVSPGPSLASALPALAARRGGVVVAALQSLRPLLDAGIEPELVVAPDPLHFAPFVEGLEPRFGLLAADAGAPPGLLDLWPDRTALFSLWSRQLHHAAAERLGVPVLDEPFLTVSEVALVVAGQLGARDFVQIGADFVSEDPRYAFRFMARGTAGEPRPTNSHYFHAARDLSWRCPQLVAEGIRIRRLRGGLPVSGAEEIDVDDLAAIASAAARLTDDARHALEAAGRPPAGMDARRRSICGLVDLARADGEPHRRDGAGDGQRELAGEGGGRFADFDPLPALERADALDALRASLGA